MSINFKSINVNLRGLWIYSLSFILFFDFIFLRTFSDSGQTSVMFIIGSKVLQVMTLIIFALTTFVFQSVSIRQNSIINSIILFVALEMSLYFLIDGISLFGLFPKHYDRLSQNVSTSLKKFDKERDFALSTSGLLSCIVYLLFSLSKQRKQLPPT